MIDVVDQLNEVLRIGMIAPEYQVVVQSAKDEIVNLRATLREIETIISFILPNQID